MGRSSSIGTVPLNSERVFGPILSTVEEEFEEKRDLNESVGLTPLIFNRCANITLIDMVYPSRFFDLLNTQTTSNLDYFRNSTPQFFK
jgi:hypothetical protein